MSNTEDFFWDGYLHWARIMEDANPSWGSPNQNQNTDEPLDYYEPIFIRMNSNIPSADLKRLNKIYVTSVDLGESAEEQQDILTEIMKVPDFDFLQHHKFDLEDFFIGLQHTLFLEVPLEFFIYRLVARTKADHVGFKDNYTVIDVGAPALAEQRKSLIRLEGSPAFAPLKCIGAVIDNDIGFLNQRFRTSDDNKEVSRFAAIWLQSRDRLPFSPQADLKWVHIGRVLLNSEINEMIADSDQSEARIYRYINKDLHLRGPDQREPLNETHGTAVTDVAFGGDYQRGEAICKVPLLGVQLPPVAAADTSGTYSESYIVQAVRWICARARQINSDAKLIINISYGALAGQKDGGKFLEAQIEREVDLAKKLPTNNGKGQEVHVVYAFGNSYNSRQVAKIAIKSGETKAAPLWTIHPEDPTPNYMEVRRLSVTSGREKLISIPDMLDVKLTSPDGVPLSARPDPGEAKPPLQSMPYAVSRVYHVPERHPSKSRNYPAFYNVTVAPTLRYSDDTEPAGAGDWQLSFENNSGEDIELVLQIQRGDIAPGFSLGGRQSYFVGEFKDVIEDGYPTTDVICPLTNKGTNSAYTTASRGDGQIHTAEARKCVMGSDIRADYSAKAADWTNVKGASDAAVVDKMFTRGVPAAGTYSGSTTRLSGTSAAAALVSRGLII